MEIRDIIKAIGNEDSSNKKLAIMKNHSNNPTLKRLFELAYNSQYVFRIKSDRLPTTYTTMRSIHDALQDIEENILGRKVIGNNARDFLLYTLGRMCEEDAKIIHNMINKDLRIGVGSSTINKVWKGLIPKQPQQLAMPYNRKNMQNIVYPAYAQLKADGSRCFINIKHYKEADEYIITMTTREPNNYLGLSNLQDSILATLKHMKKDGVSWFVDDFDITLDGELIVLDGDTHKARSGNNGIMNKSIQGTITDEEQKEVTFIGWDLIISDRMDIPYSRRLRMLQELFDEIDSVWWKSPYVVIETTVVNSEKEALEVYRKYVDMGLEGIILKNTHSLWEDKRSKNLVKFKEVIEVDLEVIGYTKITNGEEKLGSLQLRSACGKIEVSCGSGFKDTSRKKVDGVWEEIPLTERHEHDRGLLWSKRDDLIGRVVQIECNGLVKDKTKDIHSLYLPIFQKFRNDKTVANMLEDVFEEE